MELDITRLRTALAGLREKGITDLPSYLSLHPELLQQQAKLLVVVDGNRAALEMFQAATPEFLSGPLARLLPPESYPLLRDLVLTVDGQQSHLNHETQIRTSGDQRREILVWAYVPDVQARPGNLLLTMVDITERKAAERELQLTNQLLHVIGKAQSAFISATKQSESDAFNKLLDHFLASTDSEYGFIGEVHHASDGHPYLRTHAITNIAWDEKSRQLFENRGSKGMEFTNLSTLFGAVITSHKPVIANRPAEDPRAGGLPAGHPTIQAFLGIPFISDGQIIGMVGIANRPEGYESSLIEFLQPLVTTCTGLTKALRSDNRRRQSERALREEQQRLDTVLATAPLVLWAFDKKGIFSLSRGKGLAALGLQDDEVVGRSVFDLYRDAPEVLEASQRALSGETVNTFNHVAGRWFDVRYEPMRNEKGALVGCVGAALDVTERVEAEQALAGYRQELEKQVRQRTEAYEEIKRYAYIFSHDLRGPLVSAKGFVSELRLDVDELLDGLGYRDDGLEQPAQGRLRRLMQESIPEALDFLAASIDKIDSLTGALLKLSRAGSREFHYEAVDMQVLVTKALEELAYSIETEGIQVDVGQLPMAWTDHSGMAQVVNNLLQNAINYLKPGVRGRIAVTGGQKDGELIFSVRDNGVGIAKDDLQHIFEPFRRAREHSAPGEGMGLTFVQTLVRRMGGRIWCESEPGEGSTFSLAIPLRPDQDGETQIS